MSQLSNTPVTRRTALLAGASVAAALGLGACSSSGAGSSGKTKTLKIAFFGTQKAADSASVVAKPFLQAHPGVKVHYQGITGTDWNDFFAKILTQVAGGNPPDLTYIATEGLQQAAKKGLATPVDDYVKQDAADLKEYFADVHPALVEAMLYQGHLYAMPTDFNAGNMYFNMPLLSQASVDLPQGNWSIDDFHNMALKFRDIPKAVAFDWVVRLWGSWTSFMYANGGNLLTEGKYPGGDWLWSTFYPNDPAAKGRGGGWQWGAPTANDTAVVEALDYMIQLKKDGLSPSPDVGGGGTLQGLFASNKIAMTIGGGFWAGGLHAAGMKKGTFDVQYFPRWKTQRALFGTGGYGIFKSSPNKDLAWEFMKSVLSPSAINIICGGTATTPGNNTTPTRKSMMTASRYAATGPRNWPVFYNTLTDFDNTAPIPAPPYYNALAVALNQRTTQAMSSGNAKAALDGLQSDLETAAKSG